MENNYKMVAKTLFGFEELLSKELTQLGAREVKIGVRNVSFVGVGLGTYSFTYSFRFRCAAVAEFVCRQCLGRKRLPSLLCVGLGIRSRQHGGCSLADLIHSS